jgi:hypothetical protein
MKRSFWPLLTEKAYRNILYSGHAAEAMSDIWTLAGQRLSKWSNMPAEQVRNKGQLRAAAASAAAAFVEQLWQLHAASSSPPSPSPTPHSASAPSPPSGR